MAEDTTEDARRVSRARLERARLARIFGDVLPDRTTDESGDDASSTARSGEGFSESWLRDQRPPHHS